MRQIPTTSLSQSLNMGSKGHNWEKFPIQDKKSITNVNLLTQHTRAQQIRRQNHQDYQHLTMSYHFVLARINFFT